MEILQRAAEILVKRGYATSFFTINKDGHCWIRFKGTDKEHTHVNPFSDTLEGRRQADAIEDWVRSNEEGLWDLSGDDDLILNHDITHRHWRLDRIKWCLGELNK